jgi:hypothetical protein
MLSDSNKYKLEGGILITNMSASSNYYNLELVYNTNHALPQLLNLFNNAFFNYRSNLSMNNSQHYEIHTYSRPWKGESVGVIGAIFVDILFLGLVIFAYALVPSSACVPLIKERETGVKQLQLISGTSKFAYCVSNLLWDILISIPTVLLTCLILFIGNKDLFGGTAFGASLLILLTYVIDSTLLSYLLSMLWTKHVKAQVVVFIVYFVVGVGLLSGILTPVILFGSGHIVVKILSYCFCLLCPQFALVRGFMVLVNFGQYRLGITLGKLVFVTNC